MSAVDAVAEVIKGIAAYDDWAPEWWLRASREYAEDCIAAYEAHLAAQGKVIVDCDVLRVALMTDHEMEEFSMNATWDEWQAACEKFNRLRAALAPPVEE